MPPVFDHLQYAKVKGEGLVFFFFGHVIHSADDINGSRQEDEFTLVSSATEKVKKQEAKRQVLLLPPRIPYFFDYMPCSNSRHP